MPVGLAAPFISSSIAAAAPSLGSTLASAALSSLPSLVGSLGQIGGSYLSGRSAGGANALQLAFAREQAQNKIRWAVADAKAAGLHPLAAVGGGVSGAASPSLVANPWQGSAFATGANYLGGLLDDAIDHYIPDEDGMVSQPRASYEVRRLLEDALSRSAIQRSSRVRPVLEEKLPRVRKHWDGRKLIYTNPRDPGDYSVLPWSDPQQVIEDEFGGIVGEPYGSSRMFFGER